MMRLLGAVLLASVVALVAAGSVEERRGTLLASPGATAVQTEDSGSWTALGALAGEASGGTGGDRLLGSVTDRERLQALVSRMEVTDSHDLELSEQPVPVRVTISAIGLEAVVAQVGVTAAGDFDVPSPQVVGWYRYGALPGQSGSAVLAAHVDFGTRPGAFRHLGQLVSGDQLVVEFSDGSTAEFEVIEQALYDKESLPADELFGHDGASLLRLVTCGGVYDSTTRHYTGNRVVTAIPVATPGTERG